MINFCTLFDSNYLDRGLLMYESLKNTGVSFHLFIFAFDDIAYNYLAEMRPDNVTVISLKQFENEKLLSIKSGRTKAEYCWTATSSTLRFVFDNFKVESCTYLDADLYFYNSPQDLLNELPPGKSIMITEHRFSGLAEVFEKKRAGRFCVQYVTFRNEAKALAALDKWIGQCIDWCYDRYEDGRFGDQKYLDTWPDEYDFVYISRHIGNGVAPWNNFRYSISRNDSEIMISEGSSQPVKLIYYHFHYVKLLNAREADIGWNRIRKDFTEELYKPYIRSLIEKDNQLEKSGIHISRYTDNTGWTGPRDIFKYLIKRFLKFNIINFRN